MSDVQPRAIVEDWAVEMQRTATLVGEVVGVQERSRNPLVPNDFLDFSRAGFPSDIIVKAVLIPATGNPRQMMQYDEYRRLLWQHVKWDWISSNGGLDGKASVPGAESRDIGGGERVATLSGYYLMYALRAAYLQRRAQNVERANRKLEQRVIDKAEEHDNGARTTGFIEPAQTLTVDDLLKYEAELPPLREGAFTSQ